VDVNASTIPKVRNAPGYPAQIPNPRLPDLYEIRSTLDMGMGVFAKRDIVRGEIIFSERPLLVIPDNIKQLRQGDALGHSHQITLSEYESLLEAAVASLPPENQAGYRPLQNNYTSDKCGPLLGIVRTNNYALTTYTMVPTCQQITLLLVKSHLGLTIGVSLVPFLQFSAMTRLRPSQLHTKCEVLLQARLFLYTVLRPARHQSRRSTVLLLLSSQR
jgi:hypothetical protein